VKKSAFRFDAVLRRVRPYLEANALAEAAMFVLAVKEALKK
jgi:hypothetical protein